MHIFVGSEEILALFETPEMNPIISLGMWYTYSDIYSNSGEECSLDKRL